MHEGQDEPEGPRLRAADQPNRAQRKASWRQDALFELEELGDLFNLPASVRHVDPPGVRL
ncbi:hypothetical protein ACQEVY_25455 [Streptomyces sp. CA-288835]|uniref:hypothetical protein n=1 Tax=Streptomyces sp. CA-288835 TaxID=3240069 RepID=UPI003D940FC2